MPSALRTTLVSSLISLSLGCSFFDIEDAGKPIIPKKSSSASKAGAPGSGATGGSAGTGTGTGGSAGGSGGTGGSNASGSGGSGVGGEAPMAGSGGSAGSAVMAGAGDGSGGMPSLGGMGGTAGNDMPTAGSGMVAGSSAGGSGPIDSNACTSMKADAKTFGGHCYLLVTNAVNFDAAKNDCMSMQAHLVTISNGDPEAKDTFDAENTFVYGLAGGKDTWLGLADGKKDRDPGDGTPYKWIDDEPSPPSDWGMAYGWQSGEPNNYQKPCMNGDTCYEHCGFMLSDQGDKWNDDLCESTKQYVCEWDTAPSAMGK